MHIQTLHPNILYFLFKKLEFFLPVTFCFIHMDLIKNNNKLINHAAERITNIKMCGWCSVGTVGCSEQRKLLWKCNCTSALRPLCSTDWRRRMERRQVFPAGGSVVITRETFPHRNLWAHQRPVLAALKRLKHWGQPPPPLPDLPFPLCQQLLTSPYYFPSAHFFYSAVFDLSSFFQPVAFVRLFNHLRVLF